MPDTTPTPADRPADQLRVAAEPVPFRYVDEDDYCLSSRLLPDLNTGGTTGTVSITIEGSDEPQSAHVPVAELTTVLAGIAESAGLAVARQLLGTTEGEDDQDTIGLCGYCGVPRETHHHGYVSTAAALAAAPHHVTAAPPPPADRAAGMTEAADFVRRLLVSRPGITTAGLEAELRTMAAEAADEAAAGVQPPTSEATRSYRLEHRRPGDTAWQRNHPGIAANWSWQSREKADQRLAEARDRWPDFEHRLIETTTTVTEQPAAPAAPEGPTP